jgi:hypothetical protein
MQPQGRTRRLLHFLGIDKAVGFTLAGQFWNIVSAPLLLGLIVTRLTLNERGVIVNFAEISNFQHLFELGTGAVIQQLASRERAFLAPRADGTLGGDPNAKARLGAILRTGLPFFAAVILIANLGILPIGWRIFSNSSGVEAVDWKFGWVFTVFATAVNGVALSMLLFLSGCGFVAAVARVSAIQAVVSTAALVVGLAINLRVVAHPFSGAVGMTVSLAWLLLWKRRLLVDLWRTDRQCVEFGWRTHVWPLQWRVSISHLCLQAVIRILSIFVLYFQGAAAAGQIGVAWFVLMQVQLIGTGWVATKIPSFGVLASQKKWSELDHVFRGVLLRSTAVIAGLSVLVVAVSAAIYGASQGWGGEELVARVTELAGPDAVLPGPLTMGMLALVVVSTHVIGTQAAYLRAHGREPLVPVTLTLAVAVAVTLALTGKYGSATAMVVGFTAWIVVLGLGGGTYIFLNMRRRWHQPEPPLAV